MEPIADPSPGPGEVDGAKKLVKKNFPTGLTLANDTVIQLHRGSDNFLLQATRPDNILAKLAKKGLSQVNHALDPPLPQPSNPIPLFSQRNGSSPHATSSSSCQPQHSSSMDPSMIKLPTSPEPGNSSRDHQPPSSPDSPASSPQLSVSSLIPCNLDVFDIEEGQQLRVVDRIAESNAPVYRFEVGHIAKKTDKMSEWKKAEGRSHIAGKIMEHTPYHDNKDPLHGEFQFTSNLLAQDPVLAFNTIVPGLCWAKAEYMTPSVWKTTEEFWVGGETLRVYLMPMHGSLTVPLDERVFTLDEERHIWETAYRKVKQLHSLGAAHQDIKPENILIKSQWVPGDEEDQLLPINIDKLDLLLVDFGSSCMKTDSSALAPAGGTNWAMSVSVVTLRVQKRFESVRKSNPRLVYQPGKHKSLLRSRQPDDYVSGSWKEEDVSSFFATLKHFVPPKVDVENDIWALGMSLLDYLDHDYVKATAMNGEFFKHLERLLPLSGRVATRTELEEFIKTGNSFFSPIFDSNNRTWKLKLNHQGNRVSAGKVGKEWWELLDMLLIRPQTGWILSNIHGENLAAEREARWNELGHHKYRPNKSQTGSASAASSVAGTSRKRTLDQSSDDAPETSAAKRSSASSSSEDRFIAAAGEYKADQNTLEYHLPERKPAQGGYYVLYCHLNGCKGGADGRGKQLRGFKQLDEHVRDRLCACLRGPCPPRRPDVKVFNHQGQLHHEWVNPGEEPMPSEELGRGSRRTRSTK